MIREIEQKDLAECVKVIRNSFATVAKEFNITPENAPRYTAFATDENRLNWHLNGEHRHDGIGAKLLTYAFGKAKEQGCVKMKIGIVEENQVLRRWYETFGFVHVGTQKFEFFPFTCGYMEKMV